MSSLPPQVQPPRRPGSLLLLLVINRKDIIREASGPRRVRLGLTIKRKAAYKSTTWFECGCHFAFPLKVGLWKSPVFGLICMILVGSGRILLRVSDSG